MQSATTPRSAVSFSRESRVADPRRDSDDRGKFGAAFETAEGGPIERKGHRSMLNRLEKGVGENFALLAATLTVAIVTLLVQMFHTKAWKASTLLKYFATCQAISGTSPILLQRDPE